MSCPNPAPEQLEKSVSLRATEGYSFSLLNQPYKNWLQNRASLSFYKFAMLSSGVCSYKVVLIKMESCVKIPNTGIDLAHSIQVKQMNTHEAALY